ncbi:hypothetical protein SeMB42_g01858 [Synchytrium endobioticum]|uniref:Actin-like protein ARP6 n=1 Tax=Synchytrium endobioticum TaxID=286115 RepID=A0A507DJ71_9FUNG|nr:hypothetical protein SeLEV6574_g03077 [Synchytrium endobioticum]TPX51556.1 hypothetical protein SeMB42_g01858 [Synchytrium endobioticum]
MSKHTLILDNGAFAIKAGYADAPYPPYIAPNCIMKGKADRTTYVADQICECRNFAGLFYRVPFEKGYVTGWDIEKDIWDRVFSPHVLACNPSSTDLIITEPPFNLPALADAYDEMIFEEYGFQRRCRITAAELSVWNDLTQLLPPGTNQPPSMPECVLVVDTGFSFTHILPLLNGFPILDGLKRINIGGKLLTNHLKELISFRQWNMMDETYVINEVKEMCCFISTDFNVDLKTAQLPQDTNPLSMEYLLPDFVTNMKGTIRSKDSDVRMTDDDQVLIMNSERFCVPELLFRPSDIGIEQAGVSEVIVRVIESLPTDMQPGFYANILIIGGNACMQGFKERVEADLRTMAPTHCRVRVAIPDDPITFAYHGGIRLAQQFPDVLNARMMSRNEYFEQRLGHQLR